MDLWYLASATFLFGVLSCVKRPIIGNLNRLQSLEITNKQTTNRGAFQFHFLFN